MTNKNHKTKFTALGITTLLQLSLSLLLPSLSHAGAPSAPECGASASHFENGTDVAIADNTTITSTITVSGVNPFIWDLDLVTFIQHTFSADIDMTLTSPAGTVVTISSDNGGGNDNVFNGTLWDDDSNPLGVIPHTSSGGNIGLVTDNAYTNDTTATPLVSEEPLAAFYGENPNGVWTLRVHDDTGGDTGTLGLWALDFVTLPNAPATTSNSATVVATTVNIPDNNTGTATSAINVTDRTGRVCGVTVSLSTTHTFTGDIQATLTSPSGTVLTIISNVGGGSDNVISSTSFSTKADPGNQLPFPSNTFAASLLATDTTYTNLVAKTQLVPEESFGAFTGEVPNGTWTLTLADTGLGDIGQLTGWGLALSTCKPAADADADLTGDSCDGCPNDAAKTTPGVCGCGVVESLVDTDSDGTKDCLDACPTDAAKIIAGACGCGVADTNSDGDTLPNCTDGCPTDAAKTILGTCGCGVSDADSNGNSQADCLDPSASTVPTAPTAKAGKNGAFTLTATQVSGVSFYEFKLTYKLSGKNKTRTYKSNNPVLKKKLTGVPKGTVVTYRVRMLAGTTATAFSAAKKFKVK